LPKRPWTVCCLGDVYFCGRGIAHWSPVTKEETRHNPPASNVCEERQRLSEAFLSAIRDLTDLLDQQAQAIIEQDRDFSRFEDLLHLARAAKDEAKYALVAHLEEHKCG
jgi:hypothetical protein